MRTIANYCKAHYYSSACAFNQLQGTPLKSLLSIFIISFAFILPTGIWLVTENMNNLVSLKDPGAKINVFFNDNNHNKAILLDKYSKHPAITTYSYNSATDNAHLLQDHLGNIDISVINTISQLPASIVFYLKDDIKLLDAQQLKLALINEEIVEHTQLDLEWLIKWQSIISLCNKLTILVTCLLTIGAAFIIGNLTKSSIEQQRESISVKNLLGASQSYIRRDFLYLGFWRGFVSGVLTILIVKLLILSLSSNFNIVFADVMPNAKLISLDIKESLFIIIVSTTVGVLGAWLAYNSHHHLLVKTK